jgi:hypothetical protein
MAGNGPTIAHVASEGFYPGQNLAKKAIFGCFSGFFVLALNNSKK